jgi:hypothetical protein
LVVQIEGLVHGVLFNLYDNDIGGLFVITVKVAYIYGSPTYVYASRGTKIFTNKILYDTNDRTLGEIELLVSDIDFSSPYNVAFILLQSIMIRNPSVDDYFTASSTTGSTTKEVLAICVPED